MANIYYKSNSNQYKKFSYVDIGAAAANHKHAISDIYGWNFKDNGCLGQNILQNFKSNNNMILYVPHTNSDIVYTKLIPDDIINNHSIVFYNNQNKIFKQENITGTNVSITPERTTAYQYNGIGQIISQTEFSSEYKYYYYTYPLQIIYTNENIENYNYDISLSFKTNIDDGIWTIEFSKDNNNIQISDISYSLNNIPENYSVGLVENNSQVTGISIIKKELKNIVKIEDIMDKQQIEITDITISTAATITVSQHYIDYYDYNTIPDIASSGSLGPVNVEVINNYDTTSINDMIRYYRSYKFKNLLTWGQKFYTNNIIIPGYCDQINTYTRGFFLWDIPYEFDKDIKPKDISIIGYNEQFYSNQYHLCDIWALGAYAAHNQPLVKSLTNNQTPVNNQITYQIYKILPGIIQFFLVFPTALNANISQFCPLKFVANYGLTVSIATQNN